ncbi:MAG: trigger factor [Rhodovibrionaceae bacterium]
MQVTETNTDGLKREFTVVISAKDLNEKTEARLSELGQNIKVPGFRPGKVPMSVLKQRYGQNVMGEVLERAVQDSSSQALQERGVRPAMQPKVEITKFEEGKDLEYTMELEIMPEFEPMDFSKLELEKVEVEVPEKEVDEALERIASQRTETKPLSKARKSQKGDVLVIDFKGSVDGESFPGMDAEDHHLELGSNAFVAGFEEQLIGLDKGKQTDVKVTFPEQYANDKLAGREAVFDVTVKDILETVPAKLDDEMAKAYGEESLEGLKNRVRQELGKDYGQLTRSKMKRELLDQLADNHDFKVPAGMVDAEFETIWKQIEEAKKNDALDDDDKGKSDDQLREEYRTIAERRVRLGLLLSEVGRLNQVDVTQEELNSALIQEAQRHPGQERQVIEFFQKNPDALANLRAPIYEDKVIDFIIEQAKVTERKMTVDELQAELEAENSGEGEAPKKPSSDKSGAKDSGAKKAAAGKSGGAKKAAAKKS